ncbi:MAG: hypothetical protein KDJ52_09970 [Anaerolineae bacterium]|nr:hypothetical protein [Anaerolineae bacterium]
MMVTNVETPIRPLLTIGFILICPGMALVQFLRLKEPIIEITLAIALSIGISTVLSEVMALGKIWHPEAGLAALIILTIVGSIIRMTQIKNEQPLKNEIHITQAKK